MEITVTVTVCDVCKDRDRPTKRYEVHDLETGHSGVTDRCQEDGAELALVIEGPRKPAKAPAKKAATRRGVSRKAATMTMEEIEAAKRKAR